MIQFLEQPDCLCLWLLRTSLCGVQYVYGLVRPVNAPMRGGCLEADVVERMVVLLHAHLG